MPKSSLLVLALLPLPLFSQTLQPVDSSQFFFAPSEPAVLKWTAAPATSGQNISYQIISYGGGTVAQGSVPIADGWEISLPVNLPEGFYVVQFPKEKQEFGLLSQAKFQRPVDPYFGMDASLSWLAPVSARAGDITVMKNMGVSIARERMAWPTIEPERGKWDWEADKGYESTRQLYAGAGMPILELFHATPAWAKTGSGRSFPDDLPVAEQSWETIATRWGHYWGGLEVWNEPDIAAGQGGPQAERYVPLVKTLKYALQNAGSRTQVGGGVMAYFTESYLQSAGENGMLQSCDFLSFHYYKDPLDLEPFVAGYRDYLHKYGRETLPLWITEAGAPLKAKRDTHRETQADKASALHYAELLVEGKACGIARMFPFVLPDYSEKEVNNFGLLAKEGSPLRPLAAVAQAIRVLSGLEYAGDLTLDSPTVRARVFKGTGDAIVVLEGKSPGGVKVPFPFGGVVEGIDGRPLETKDGAVPLDDGLAYVRVPLAQIQPKLQESTRAMALFRLGTAPCPPLAVSPIVLEASLDSAAFTEGVRGYEIPDGTATLPFHVRVDNLGTAAGSVSLTFPDGQVHAVSVNPHAFADITETLPTSTVHFDPNGTGQLAVQGVAPAAGTILPAVIRISAPFGLDTYFHSHAYRFTLPIGDLNRWVKNCAGTVDFSPGTANGVKFTLNFTAADRWAYPRFTLPQEVDLDRIEGVLVRGRCSQSATVRVMTWGGTDNNNNLTGYSIFPADGAWHVAYVPLSEFLAPHVGQKLGRQIRDISVGINGSKTPENELEISDLILLGN